MELTDVITIFVIGALTALATGIGAIPVFGLPDRKESSRIALIGVTIGVMGTAAIVGLLLPSLANLHLPWPWGMVAFAGCIVVGINLGLLAGSLLSRKPRSDREEA